MISVTLNALPVLDVPNAKMSSSHPLQRKQPFWIVTIENTNDLCNFEEFLLESSYTLSVIQTWGTSKLFIKSLVIMC